MNFFASRFIIASIFVFSTLIACVQMPTERQGAVDLRPSIMFDASDTTAAAQASVLIDGVVAGPLSAFSNGTGSLRLLNGNHLVQVKYGTNMIFDQRIYFADGAQRRVQVNFSTTP